ncbi:hypothetical protein [Dyella terrae]|uniref:hypothetical protein n=1 Tax=Dyella terrae TaxID=522259 RepID=UPI001EFE3F23|nr:hypothetical protein [Dyella terrae]
MSLTRDQLLERFVQLDAELIKLKTEGQAEEVLWEAFERLAQVPSSAVDHRDRVWWWEQVYATMERHGLTELSRGHLQHDFP